MKYYLEDINKIFDKLKSSKNGLSSSEADNRLQKYGKNEFKKPKKQSLIVHFFKQMTDPMIIVLICAAAVSLTLAIIQNDSFADVIIILAVVIINAILGVYQENKAEKSIEALQEMAAAKSKVIRNGKEQIIYSSELVVGDIVVLEAGDAVPADGRIIEATSLKIEEAALTGESVPVNKLVDILNDNKANEDVPLADRKNMAYMGTTVSYGLGKMLVTATGMQTEMGKIAGALSNAVENKTPLQIKMAQLSKSLTKIVILVCVVVFAVQLFRMQEVNIRYILDAFMVAVTLAVAAIPEGLPAVVTVVLSLGVTKMSKRNAIIRKLTAVETLGCAQIICSDKTGTLTQNKMTVTDFYSDNKTMLEVGMALCCDAKIEDGQTIGEPTEAALVEWAAKDDYATSVLDKKYKYVSELPFDSTRKMMSVLVSPLNSDNVFSNICSSMFIQITKGAPDVVLSKCSHALVDGKIVALNERILKSINKANSNMADKALRVLSCAIRCYTTTPKTLTSENIEKDMIFVGLTGMIDPIRPEVKDAIVECKSAGITPIMITGDYIDTAKAIAKDLGILSDGYEALSGSELNKLSDKEFDKKFKQVRVYARVQPEHKTRIVKAWQNAGYVCAMTGDGVNDAPSIKSADIGVGMGITGTDVTKNVADMVLADDNFSSIVNAVEEGRRIYDNIIKCTQYLLSSNIGEVLSVLFASICAFTIMRPVHLLWVNLVTDCFPALALGVEGKEPGLMERKPREKNAGIFADGLGFDILYQGIAVTALIVFAYLTGHYLEFGDWGIAPSEQGITMAFFTTSIVGCMHALNLRSRRQSIFKLKSQNWLLLGSVVFSFVLTTVICFVPSIADAFLLTRISLEEYIITVVLSFAIIPIVEIVKFIQRKFGF